MDIDENKGAGDGQGNDEHGEENKEGGTGKTNNDASRMSKDKKRSLIRDLYQ